MNWFDKYKQMTQQTDPLTNRQVLGNSNPSTTNNNVQQQPKSNVCRLVAGYEFYRMVKAEGFMAGHTPLCKQEGTLTESVASQEFVVVNTRQCYIIRSEDKMVDLSKTHMNLTKLIEVKSMWLGNILVPESALIINRTMLCD